MCNDDGVIVDFNTADPLIRWDSYESLGIGGEGRCGCHSGVQARGSEGGLLLLPREVSPLSAQLPETLPSLGAQSPRPRALRVWWGR